VPTTRHHRGGGHLPVSGHGVTQPVPVPIPTIVLARKK